MLRSTWKFSCVFLTQPERHGGRLLVQTKTLAHSTTAAATNKDRNGVHRHTAKWGSVFPKSLNASILPRWTRLCFQNDEHKHEPQTHCRISASVFVCFSLSPRLHGLFLDEFITLTHFDHAAIACCNFSVCACFLFGKRVLTQRYTFFSWGGGGYVSVSCDTQTKQMNYQLRSLP